MSEADRNALGATLKDRGNKLYSKKEFKKAVECYTKAIEVSVRKDAVFYSNRAACELFTLLTHGPELIAPPQATPTTRPPSTSCVSRTATRRSSLTALSELERQWTRSLAHTTASRRSRGERRRSSAWTATRRLSGVSCEMRL